ncbi:FecR domain-containing protein [Methylocystis rosea]|uniref:FecR domain-containing protein n=1 Tax=Methylocystis rosea TaxID=173366 RepID=A0ABX6EKU3_9HYPH|nr:FecR family protein [Methylocystis rosea]QGM95408.1 FecR domain-containing protein [Methylocystis rosea]
MKKFSAAATTALALVAGPALADNVGNVGAVNQSAHGTPPGAAKRSLSVGLGVQRRERIETSPYGSAQIVFNDTSTMTVGRNSAVTVDDFVYSQGGGGQQGVSMAKGVMRFVGGGVSHEGGTKLRTPTASIGVRGGTALVRVGGSCGTLVVHQYGFIDVGGQALTRPGYGVCAPSGGPVSEPFLVPPETIAQIVAALESGKGQRGGAKREPTNEEANLALGNDRPPDVVSPPGLDALGPVWFGNAIVQSRANVDNQPTPLPTPARQGGNDGHHDDHDHGGHGGHGGHDHGGHEGGHGGHGEGGHGGHGEGGHGGHGEGGHGGHGEGGHGGEGGYGGGYGGGHGEGGHGGGYEGGEGGQYSGGGQGSHGSGGHGSGGHGGGPVAIDGPGY